ncbi:unnamed protein product, partial [Lymnaea stagnalis]
MVLQILEVLSKTLMTIESFEDLIDSIDVLMRSDLSEKDAQHIILLGDIILKNSLSIIGLQRNYRLTTRTINAVVRQVKFEEEFITGLNSTIKMLGDGQDKNKTYFCGLMVFQNFQSLLLNNGNQRKNMMALSVLPA